MDLEQVDPRDHWGSFGVFVANEVGDSSHADLAELLYRDWYALFPDAEVDELVGALEEEAYDHYRQWAAVTWSPDNIAGGTSSLLGVLTIGEHRYVAQEPDSDAGEGWMLLGAADDKEGAIWDYLVDLLHPDCPLPDSIEADLPQSKIRELLSDLLSDRPDAVFGWEALAEKLELRSGDRELLLDRYMDAAEGPAPDCRHAAHVSRLPVGPAPSNLGMRAAPGRRPRLTPFSVLALAVTLAACSGDLTQNATTVGVPTTTSASAISTTSLGSEATATAPGTSASAECELADATPTETDVPSPYFVFSPAEQCANSREGSFYYEAGIRPLDKGAANAKEAIELLFAGVSEEDEAQGYYSALGIHPEVLTSVVQNGGVVEVDFSAEIYDVPNISTSNVRGFAMAQLVATIFSDPTAQRAVLSVDGSVDAFCLDFLGEDPGCELTRG